MRMVSPDHVLNAYGVPRPCPTENHSGLGREFNIQDPIHAQGHMMRNARYNQPCYACHERPR